MFGKIKGLGHAPYTDPLLAPWARKLVADPAHATTGLLVIGKGHTKLVLGGADDIIEDDIECTFLYAVATIS